MDFDEGWSIRLSNSWRLACKKLRISAKVLSQMVTSTRPDEGLVRQQMRVVDQDRSVFESWKMSVMMRSLR